MKEWILENYGLKPNEFLVFKDIASSFGTRPALQKLVDELIAGKLTTIVSEHEDRLSRVSSERKLLEHLAESHDTKIVYAKSTIQDETDQVYFVKELVEFITVISNRVSARKAAEICRKDVPEAVIERIKRLHRDGHSFWSITEVVEKEGYRNDKTGEPFSYYLIQRAFRENLKLKKLTDSPEAPDTIETFIAERCTVSKDESVLTREIYSAYVKYCEESGISKPAGLKSFSRRITALGYQRKYSYKKDKEGALCLGIALREK